MRFAPYDLFHFAPVRFIELRERVLVDFLQIKHG
jgi:hypothetical protein